MLQGEWKDAVIAINTALSAEVDLGRVYDKVLVVIPTITAASISLQVAEKSGGPFQDLWFISDTDGDDKQPLTLVTGTGAITVIFPLGGFCYIKVKSSANQAAAKTFRVCGIR